MWQWHSEPFGVNLADEDPDGNGASMIYNLRFSGQHFDAETGLHYNVARDYDPVLGRYLTSDPIGLLGGLNTYTYVDNNPAKLIDSDGLSPGWLLGGVIGRILGQTPEEIAYGSKLLDVGLGMGAPDMPDCIGATDISMPLELMRGVGGVQAIGLSTSTTIGLYGVGATVSAAGAAAVLPIGLAGYGGAQVGLSVNSFYERARGNSLGSDIYDLIKEGRLYDYQKSSRCGCAD